MDDSAQAELIKVATRAADRRAPGTGGDDTWLQEFRKAYRHLAVSTGDTLRSGETLTDMLAMTERELTAKPGA
jgi:hypothetical protein